LGYPDNPCDKRRRANPFVVLFISFTLFSLACNDPVQPPTEKVRLTETGKTVLMRSTFLTKAIQTVHDMRKVAETFEFSKILLDTHSMRVRFWNPENVIEGFRGGLSKKNSSRTENAVGTFAQALSRSVTFTEEVPKYSDSVIDSLADLVRDTGWIRYVHQPADVDSAVDSLLFLPIYTETFDSTLDSLVADTTHYLQTVLTLRWRTISGVALNFDVYDRRQWQIPTQKLQSRRQVKKRVGSMDTLYYHYAGIKNGNIKDTIREITGSEAHYMWAERIAPMENWWNEVSQSKLAALRDSTVFGPGRYVSFQLSEYILGEEQVYVYNFTNPDTQKVRIVGMSVGITEGVTHSIFDIVHRYDPAKKETDLISYSRTDRLPNALEPVYELKPVADSLCSLYVSYSPVEIDDSPFGDLKSVQYTYQVEHDSLWKNWTYNWFQRRDVPKDTARYGAVYWTHIPNEKTTLDSSGGLSEGLTRARVMYAPGHPDTREEIWTREEARYSYTWIGATLGDTMHLKMDDIDADETGYSWAMGRADDAFQLRSGTLGKIGDSTLIVDTLYDADSRVTRAIFKGQNGTAHVTGIDDFTISVRDNNLSLSCATGECAEFAEISFRRDTFATWGNIYIITGRDVDSLVYTARLEQAPTGNITGSIRTTGDDILIVTENIGISPLYRGTGTISGIFEGPVESLIDTTTEEGNFEILEGTRTGIRYNLWQTNCLNQPPYCFR